MKNIKIAILVISMCIIFCFVPGDTVCGKIIYGALSLLLLSTAICKTSKLKGEQKK